MSTASTTTSAPVLTAEMFEQERAKLAKDATGNVISETPARLDSLARPSGTNAGWPGYDGARQGAASDNDLSETQRQAVEEAIRVLGPYVDHPAVGGLIGSMQAVADGPGSRFVGDGNDDDEDRLGVELAKVEATRTAIQKGELRAPEAMRERLDKASRELQAEYLARVSQGAQRAELAKAHERSLLPTPLVA